MLSHYLKKENKIYAVTIEASAPLNTGYKIYTNILNTRLQTIAEAILIENQSGFRKGRSCINNVFALNQII
jgi:hypothetical protein